MKHIARVISIRDTELQRMLGGLNSGDLLLIGGPPGSARVLLLSRLVVDLAVEQRIPLFIRSLEMDHRTVIGHLITTITEKSASTSGISNTTFYTVDEFRRFVDGASRIHDAPLWIDDVPNLSFETTEQLSMCPCHSIVFIDYLNLISIDEEMSTGSRLVRICKHYSGLAKQLDICIVGFFLTPRNGLDDTVRAQLEENAQKLVLLPRSTE